MHTANQLPTDSNTISEETQQEMNNISQRIHDAEQAMMIQDPQIKSYCAQIWRQFLACPELVHILRPEVIGTYVKTLSQISAIEITKEKPAKSSKALKNISLDDL